MRTHWNNPNPPRPDQIDLAQPVDWSHPQARGLRFYYSAVCSFGGQFRDLKKRGAAVNSGSPIMTPVAGWRAFRTSAYGAGTWSGRYSDDYAYAAHTLGDPTTGQYDTTAVWVCTQIGNYGHVNSALSNASIPNSGAPNWLLSFHTGGETLGLYSVNWLTLTTNAVPNTWFHVAWAYSASGLRVYLNGQYAGILGMVAPQPYVYFGSGYDQGLAGGLADVRQYNRTLSPGEIYRLWHPSSRWAMLRTLTRRRVFVLPTVTTSPWFFRNLILRRGRSA